MRQAAVRIEDVAARAGVSMKTVSRVLNGEPHVRDVLKEKVRQAAEELGYKPNQAARRLAGRRSFLIALLYHHPSTTSYLGLIQAGAARKCRALGYHLVVEPVDRRLSDFTELTNTLVDVIAPDGVIVLPPIGDLPALTRALQARETPFALISAGARSEGLHVFIDERGAARDMTNYLIELGHRRIGMVLGPSHYHAASERFDGYREALSAAGLPFMQSLVMPGTFLVEGGMSAGLSLLQQPNPPTAIFAANDSMAIGVMNAARSLGLDVPRDVSICGFDDQPVGKITVRR